MSLSVIIPSRTMSNLLPCINAVRRHESGLPVFVIDDGLAPDDSRLLAGLGASVIFGQRPFIFARAANQGIAAAGTDADVILLNDDALLESPGGFTALQRLAEQHPEYGVIGAVTNITGQPLQHRQNVGLRTVPHIAFVCVLIPRRAIDRVGLLDERYCLDYGCEDLDYCEACMRAGLKVGVYDGCYVDHSKLRSTFRGDPLAPRDFSRNHALFHAKWGAAGI